jgi:formiminotetrahydrofolate cyclodeaminase
LAQNVAAHGNVTSVSDVGVAALMFHAACEGAALNVRINLGALSDEEFVGWKSDELESILKTSRMMVEETQSIVASRMEKN